MADKNKTTQDDGLVAVESALSKTEQFIENNQKLLLIILGAIVVVIGGYMGYKKLYKEPLEQEAVTQMFMAERNFERDSFKLALNGDINYPGFLGIIEDYSSTKSANLAKYYAGVCYVKLGKYDEAISFLSDFSTEDNVLKPISIGLTGDAYMEKNDVNNAISFYKKASETASNDFVTPIYLYKLGRAYETANNNNEALSTYQKILNEFPKSNEARTVEKNIASVKIKLGTF